MDSSEAVVLLIGVGLTGSLAGLSLTGAGQTVVGLDAVRRATPCLIFHRRIGSAVCRECDDPDKRSTATSRIRHWPDTGDRDGKSARCRAAHPALQSNDR